MFEIRPILGVPVNDELSLSSEGFLGGFFKRREDRPKLLTPDMVRVSGARPERVFVVGDIHGCRRELETLLEWLITRENLSSRDLVVFVGDYVDRGDDSAGVVELLCDFRKRFPHSVFLRGNHDQQFCQYLHLSSRERGAFLDDGGDMTLSSYSLARNADPEIVVRTIPDHHVEFLSSLKNLLEVGQFVVSHASVSNEAPLHYQRQHDLVGGGCGKEKSPHPSGKLSIFGHYSLEQIVARKQAQRMCIDTGCVRGRMLSCVEAVTDRFISVSFGDLSVSEGRVPWR